VTRVQSSKGSQPAAAGVPRLEVVIVIATGVRELLRDCLISLERHPLTDGPMRVWVVDNASADGAREIAESEFPWASVVRQEVHSGFSTANNAVLRRAVAPYVLLLNPDTVLTPGALDGAVATMERDPELAVVGVRLVRRDGSFDHAAKRSFPTVLGALGHFTGIGRRKAASGALAQYRAVELDEHGHGEVDAVNGAFMLVRRAAIESVGLLDEGYRFYGEDLDWCYRFKREGWKVWYDGSVTVTHVKGGTTGGGHRGLALNYAFHHAMARFYRKFHAGRNLPLDGAVYLALWAKFGVSAGRSAVARRSLA
jgi:N-acetylglucosaminyl-diphospho-decaprenol L-rhamnosyltransferase